MTICRTDRALYFLLALMTAIALMLVGGCASPTQGEKMVESFTRTRDEVIEAQRQVDATHLSLQALRSMPAPSLKDGFRRYKDEVAKLESEGSDAKQRAASMREEANAHIKAWQEEMATIKDPTIKASMESRRQAVSSNFEQLKKYAQDARNAYGPCLAANKEIVQALSIDLSPASIQSLSPSIDRVLTSGMTLQEKLRVMQQALNNIAAGVSPGAQAK